MRAWLRKEARNELHGAAAWYEGRQPGLGHELLDDFLGVVETITAAPELYAETAKGIRRSLMRRFPYAIFYTVRPTHIEILAVKHCRGNPADWPG